MSDLPPSSEAAPEVYERISDAVFALDNEWRFTYLNDHAESVLQQDADDLIGRSIWETFPEARGSAFHQAYAHAMRSQEPVAFEEFYPPLDTWFEVHAYPSGTGLTVYLRDITKRVLQQQELEKRERALREAYEVIADRDRSWTEQMERLLKVARGAVETEYATLSRINEESGEYVFEVVDVPSDADIAAGDQVPLEVTYCERVVGTEGTLVLDDVEADAPELAGRAGNAEWGISCYLGAPVFVGDEVYGMFCFYGMEPRDEAFSDWEVTFVELLSNWVSYELDRQHYIELLERYETLIEESTDVNAILEPEGRIEYVTPSVEYVLGYAAGDMVGENAFEYVHPEDREEMRAELAGLVDGTASRSRVEFRVRHVDGSWVWLESRGRCLLDDPAIGGLVVYTRDVTDRKQYEDRLEESNERLEQFSYMVSHDLQEPLRVVMNYLQLLKERYRDELDEDARDFIDFAVDGADRMRRMIDGLLEYSRVDTQGKPFEPTDCEAVVDCVLTDLQLQIEENDAEIVVEELPTIVGDSSQLEQLFQNLVSNALKYRDDDPPEVELGVDERDDEWVFCVADNGIGIDPEDSDRIFRVFNRLHSREEYSGTGIGLALCKKIVERHGGRIWVESDLGEGTTFYFTIPKTQLE